jgi:hypothetical protein
MVSKKEKIIFKKNIPGPNDVLRHLGPCLYHPAPSFVGLRWPAMGLHGSSLAFVGLQWVFVGHRWPSLASLGLRG